MYIYEYFINTSTYLHVNNITNSKDKKGITVYIHHSRQNAMSIENSKFNLFSNKNIYGDLNW